MRRPYQHLRATATLVYTLPHDPIHTQNTRGGPAMTETDTQLGGGYVYQRECAILLAINSFSQPVAYNPVLFSLLQSFLGRVGQILRPQRPQSRPPLHLFHPSQFERFTVHSLRTTSGRYTAYSPVPHQKPAQRS